MITYNLWQFKSGDKIRKVLIYGHLFVVPSTSLEIADRVYGTTHSFVSVCPIDIETAIRWIENRLFDAINIDKMHDGNYDFKEKVDQNEHEDLQDVQTSV